MTSKEEIIKLYKMYRNQATVAKLIGVSRQYVSQIVSIGRYKYIKKGNIKELKKNDKCYICKINLSGNIHHLDGNPQNADPSNLVYICAQCHHIVHKMRPKNIIKKNIVKKVVRSKLRKYKCYKCHKLYTHKDLVFLNKYYKVCNECINTYYNIRKIKACEFKNGKEIWTEKLRYTLNKMDSQ